MDEMIRSCLFEDSSWRGMANYLVKARGPLYWRMAAKRFTSYCILPVAGGYTVMPKVKE